MQRIPAGLPSGSPGIADDIDSPTQQAPQFSLQFIFRKISAKLIKIMNP